MMDMDLHTSSQFIDQIRDRPNGHRTCAQPTSDFVLRVFFSPLHTSVWTIATFVKFLACVQRSLLNGQPVVRCEDEYPY